VGGRRFLKNTLLLTATSVLMRGIGLAFQAYLVGRIGAEGIGLFYLVMSVSGFAATLAVSGSRFAALRLASAELGAGNARGAVLAMRRCMGYALFCGVGAAGLVWFGAGFIGGRLVGDIRTVLSLRILALSLPFLSVGAVLCGFFTAIGKVGQSSAAHLLEQGVRMLATIWALGVVKSGDLEQACAAVVVGGTAGDVQFCVLMFLLYRRQIRKMKQGGRPRGLWKRVISVAFPLAVTAYVRTALSAAENLWIPRGLRRHGADADTALAGYGTVQGMVLPVVTFPSALFVSVAEVAVPELTQAQAAGKTKQIERTVNRLIRACILFSAGAAAVLWRFANGLGWSIYESREAGEYIRILAALMPLMYLDTVTDGMLRGLGEHMWSMYVNIADACFRTAAVLFLLPRFGIGGYLFLLYASECFNFALSMGRLRKITRVRFPAGSIFMGALAAAGAAAADFLFFGTVGERYTYLVLRMALASAVYAVVLLVSGEIPLSRLLIGKRCDTMKITEKSQSETGG